MSPGDVSLEDGAISSLQEMIFSRLSQEHDGSDSLILQVFRLDLLQRGVATGSGQRSIDLCCPNCLHRNPRDKWAVLKTGLIFHDTHMVLSHVPSRCFRYHTARFRAPNI